MRIALAGNPNSGKTSMYNLLTGRNEKVGNWAGVALQFATGYVGDYLVYQIGTLVAVDTVGTGFVPGLIAVAVITAVVVYIIKKQEKKFEAEYALKKKA